MHWGEILTDADRNKAPADAHAAQDVPIFFLATGVHPKNNRDECFQRTNTHLDPKQCQRSLARWLATQMVAGRKEIRYVATEQRLGSSGRSGGSF